MEVAQMTQINTDFLMSHRKDGKNGNGFAMQSKSV